jgi:long-subunit fatty acid transport protein
LIQNIFSFSIAAAYKINNNFQTGFAYQNDFSYDHSSQGGGVPEDITDFSFETHSIRLPIVYNLKWVRLGLNVNFMNLNGTMKGLSGNLWKIIPEVGMIVTPIPEFSFGLSFYPGFSGEIKYHYNNSNYEKIYNVKFPNRIKAGTEIRLYDNRLKLSFDYHYANTSIIPGLKDHKNYHIGLDYSFNENWNFRCGFFTFYNLLENQNSFYTYTWIQINHSDFCYVTLGTTYKYKNYSFNLGIMDNIVHNSQNISYFVINFGAGYEF